MALFTLFSNAFNANNVARRTRAQRTASPFTRLISSRRLRFESLEDRRVLTTFTVTNLGDATVSGPGNAPGTLRQAIYDANVSSDADTINFLPGLTGDLRLSIADDSAINLSALLITSPITIQGNSAGLTIRRDITAPYMRFFRVALGGSLTLDSLNVTTGLAVGANGTPGQDGGSAFAGAIYNQGSLQIIASTFYNNAAIGGNSGAGGSSGAGQGGAIFNDGGSVSIRNSTFSGNSALNGTGPVVARSFGGGVYSKNGSLSSYNSTITNGNAASGRDLYIIGLGAGQTATAQLYSSIIAQSDVNREAYDINATEDFGGQVNVTGANNLIRFHNISNSAVVAITDPLLGPLTTNGGPTLTHSILAGSPAIDQGSNQLSLAVDQRGATYARVVGVKVDIGAFERQTATTPDLPGDYNGSHSVDAGDYVLWRKTKGASVPQYSGADGNGSGSVDDADYNIWRGNFGSPSSGAGAAVGSELTLTAVEVQPAAISAPRNDATLIATFAAFPPALSARTTTANYDWLGDEGTLPLSQQSRDDALLAITAVSYERRASTGKPQFPTSDFDLRDRDDHSSDEALLPEDTTGTGELAVQCDPSL